VSIIITKRQKELKKKLKKLEIDPFLIDRIIKFYPITISSFLSKVKEVSCEETASEH